MAKPDLTKFFFNLMNVFMMMMMMCMKIRKKQKKKIIED